MIAPSRASRAAVLNALHRLRTHTLTPPGLCLPLLWGSIRRARFFLIFWEFLGFFWGFLRSFWDFSDLFPELLAFLGLFGDVLRLIKEVSFGFYRFLGIFMNWWDN